MRFKKEIIQLIATFIIELMIFIPFYVADVYAAQPIISSLKATPTYDSVSITWQTDIPSTTELHYGDTSSMEFSSRDSSLSTSHSAGMSQLAPKKQYYYQARSCDSSNQCQTAPSGDFTTLSAPAPSKIVGLTNGTVTRKSVELIWNATDSSYFGYYQIYRNGNKAANATSQYNALYKDEAVAGGTTYKYEISAVNTDGSEGPKSDAFYATTLTPDTTPPSIANATITSVSLDSVTIAWSTNEDANSTIKYGISSSNLNSTQTSSNYETYHSLTLSNIQNGTTYFYKINSCDADGNCAEKSDTQPFTPSEVTELSIELTVPEIYNQGTVPITGTATPHTKVKFFVNGVYKAILTMDQNTNGSISFNVPGFSSGNNSIMAVVEDSIGNKKESQTYPVTVDTISPIVEITDLPSVISSESVVINGTTNELVNVNIYVTLVSSVDTTPPEKVTDFHSDKTDSNSVTLAWVNVNDSDFSEYIIYRNDVPIATVISSPFEDDELVSAGTSYRYEIAAVDKSCNIGEKAIVNIKTSAGNITYNETPEQESISCLAGSQTPKYTLESQYPNFMEEISLEQGLNEVIVEAVDIAGNSVKKTYSVYYDSVAPQILETNLDSLTPSYLADVTITGTVTEDSYVCVYINSEPDIASYRAEEVDESSANISELSSGSKYCANSVNGSFSIDVELRRDAEYAYDQQTSASAQTSTMLISSGTAWRNNIRIVATDQVGLNSTVEEGEIIYALCAGTGSDWSIISSNVMPTELVPRYLLEGIAQIGFNMDITWRGSGARPGITDVDITEGYPMGMSSDLETKYDLDWISQITPPSCSDESDKCYVLIDLKAQDPSLGDVNNTNWTMYKKEENLSKHHQGECFNAPFTDKNYIKSAGCVKIPLTITVNYERNVSVKVGNKYQVRKETVTQKQCVDIDVLIQPRIPPDIIPNAFLENAVKFLNSTINLIDTILEPLEKVMKATMIACFAMWALLWVKKISEGFSCLRQDVKECKCTPSAEGVTCNGEDDDKNSQCKSCIEAKINTKSVENIMHWTCDRIMCPAVPSYEKYIKDNTNNAQSNCKDKGKTGANYATETNSDQLCKNAPAGLVGDSGPIQRPANNQCCDEEYMQQWGPGCVMMNELKESETLKNPKNASELSQIWRSISNFKLCKPGENNGRQVNIDGQWFVMNRTADYDQKTDKEKETIFEWNVWVGVSRRTRTLSDGQVVNDSETIETSGQPLTGTKIIRENCKKYGVETDYKYRDGKWPKYIRTVNTETKTTELDIFQTYSIAEMKSVLNKDINISKKEDQTQIITRSNINFVYQYEKDTQLFTLPPSSKGEYTFDGNKVKLTGSPSSQSSSQPAKNEITDYIPESIVRDACSGFAEDYIVDPTDTIFHSIQCVCFSALYSYLKMYRQILNLIKDCFQTILITGDGSSGVCQAVLSYYVCDLLYYMFSCFKGYTGFGTKGAEEGGILGFFRGVAGAGAEVQQNVNQRYGETNMYKVMFVDKKIIHSACMMFFGADTDIDLTAMAEQAMVIPIASTVGVFPTERRFVGYNPIDGITNHVYRVGLMIVSGADNLDYNVYLLCSSDNSCDSTYFKNGRCDCSYLGNPMTKDITNEFGGNGQLNQGQIINQEAYVTLSYANTEEAKVRYDKVRVEYSYRDNKGQDKKVTKDVPLSQVGSEPLASCQFDTLDLRYKCAVFEEPTTACITQEPILETKNQSLASWEQITDGNVYGAVGKQLKFPFKARRETTTGDRSKRFYATLSITDGTKSLANIDQLISSDTEQDYTFGGDTAPQITIADSWFTEGNLGSCYLKNNGIGISSIEQCDTDARITCDNTSDIVTFKIQSGEYQGDLFNAGNTITCPAAKSTDISVSCSQKYKISFNFASLKCASQFTGVDKISQSDQSSNSVSKALTYTLTIYKPKSDSPTLKSDTPATCSGTKQVRSGVFTIYRGNAAPTAAAATASTVVKEGEDSQAPSVDFTINGKSESKAINPLMLKDGKPVGVLIYIKSLDTSQYTADNKPTFSGIDTVKLFFDNVATPFYEENGNSNQLFDKTIDLSTIQILQVTEGFHTFSAEVKDKKGNKAEDKTITGVYFGKSCNTDKGVCTEAGLCQNTFGKSFVSSADCGNIVCCLTQS